MTAIRTIAVAAAFVLTFIAFSGSAAAVDVDVVPELNPGSVASALTLLTAGAAMVTATRRSK